MVLQALASAAYFVGHQIPLFLLAFGILFIALAFAFKPLGAALMLPVGIVTIAGTVAWFTVTGGSITAMPWDVMSVLGVGIALIVVGRVFAG